MLPLTDIRPISSMAATPKFRASDPTSSPASLRLRVYFSGECCLECRIYEPPLPPLDLQVGAEMFQVPIWQE